jgi:hypothetical protein
VDEPDVADVAVEPEVADVAVEPDVADVAAEPVLESEPEQASTTEPQSPTESTEV